MEYLKLGLQGVSVFVGSGDSGVGSCGTDDGPDRVFRPLNPAACPWVTSVGATFVQKDHSPYDPEAGAHFSGGGFSVAHDRPAYQDAAVSTYFTEADPKIPYFHNGRYRNSTGRYNRNGRGFPDISAGAFVMVFLQEDNAGADSSQLVRIWQPSSGTMKVL